MSTIVFALSGIILFMAWRLIMQARFNKSLRRSHAPRIVFLDPETPSDILLAVAQKQKDAIRSVIDARDPQEMALLMASGDLEVIEALRQGANAITLIAKDKETVA